MNSQRPLTPLTKPEVCQQLDELSVRPKPEKVIFDEMLERMVEDPNARWLGWSHNKTGAAKLCLVDTRSHVEQQDMQIHAQIRLKPRTPMTPKPLEGCNTPSEGIGSQQSPF